MFPLDRLECESLFLILKFSLLCTCRMSVIIKNTRIAFHLRKRLVAVLSLEPFDESSVFSRVVTGTAQR